MKPRLLALALVALLASAAPVIAAPIQLTSAAWTAAATGPIIVEAFEGFAPDTYASPLPIANGIVATNSLNLEPFRVFANATFCGDTIDKCLYAAEADDLKTFSGFSAGTTLWSTNLFALNVDNSFRITVAGGSGTSVFETLGSPFLGFGDSLGLTSVSFLNLGSVHPGGGFTQSNYSFDNVATASTAAAAVPEPTSLVLLASGLAACVGLRRRRRSR